MIRRKIQSALVAARSDNVSLKTLLIRATGGVFVLRIIAQGLGLVTGVMLARLLGSVQYGAYTYAFSWLNVLTIPALLGMNTLVTREIATYRARQDWPKLWGMLRFASALTLTLALILAGGVLVVSALILTASQPDVILPFTQGFDRTLTQPVDLMPVYTLWIALLLLPFNAVTTVRAAAMRGLQRVVQGYMPDLLLRPLLFIALFGGIYMLLDGQVSAPVAMLARLLTGIIVFGYGLFILLRALNQTVERARPAYEFRSWLRSALPMLGVGLVNVAQQRLDVLMLGPLRGLEEVAYYSVALTLSGLAVMLLDAVNQSLAPAIASLYATGDTGKLQRLLTRSVRLAVLGTLPIVLLLVLFGEIILSIYGPTFRSAYPSLLILIVGQLVNSMAGSVGNVLIMGGQERIVLAGRVAGTVLYFVLNLLLIPTWGMIGAAVATTLSLITWNAILAWFAWRRLGLATTIFGNQKLW